MRVQEIMIQEVSCAERETMPRPFSEAPGSGASTHPSG